MDERSPLEVQRKKLGKLLHIIRLAIQDVLSGFLEMADGIQEGMNEQLTLEPLNDGCLDHLLSFLDIQDVIRLHLVSHRFRECAKRWMSKHEINIWIWPHKQIFDDMVSSDFFAIFGNYIKRISFHCPFEYSDLLTEYVNNVEYMRIDFYKDAIGQVSFIGHMQSLRSLHIGSWTHYTDMGFIEEVLKLQDLERLSIRNLWDFTGYRLNKLHKLKELDLRECGNVTTEHFIKAFLANRNLTSINIHSCESIGPEAYHCMVQDSRLIKSLEFDAFSLLQSEFIPGLNHLEYLIINFDLVDYTRAELILEGYLRTTGGTLKCLKCIACRNFSFSECLLFPNLTKLIMTGGSLRDHLDVVLPRVCKSFPRLEKIDLDYKSYYCVTQDADAVLNFFRQSKSLIFARLPIGDCFNVHLYKEIVSVRKKLNITERLELFVMLNYETPRYEEIVAFMEGDDYAVYRKLVEINLKRYYSCRY